MASEAALVAEGLECALCFELLLEPKLLSCTHSFCEVCIDRLLQSQVTESELCCPICRHITHVDDDDVSSLRTNIPLKSLVEDVKAARENCTICDLAAKTPASSYCLACGDYMCESCQHDHGRFKKHRAHEVVDIRDVKSGKVKVKRFCSKHTQEERAWICTSCKLSICFRCLVLKHSGKEHEVIETAAYRKRIHTRVESLNERAQVKILEAEAHLNNVEAELKKTLAIFSDKVETINQAYGESVKKMEERRDILVNECMQKREAVQTQLHNIKKEDLKIISRVSNCATLVGNALNASLEGESMDVHDGLCKDLQEILNIELTADSLARDSTCQATGFNFVRYRGRNELRLGELRFKTWHLKLERVLQMTDKEMQCFVSTSSGDIVVGYLWGGVEVLKSDGSRRQLLQDVTVWGLATLSDGCIAVRDGNNHITVYTHEWRKSNRTFKTLPPDEGMGGTAADGDDDLYVGYWCSGIIQIFRPEGGAPVSIITCNGFEPWEIYTMNHNKMIVVKDYQSVRVINKEGAVQYEVTGNLFYPTPAVLDDDKILIGWVGNGRLSIDLYSKQLRYLRPMFASAKVKDQISFMTVLATGQVAFCCQSQLLIFHKK